MVSLGHPAVQHVCAHTGIFTTGDVRPADEALRPRKPEGVVCTAAWHSPPNSSSRTAISCLSGRAGVVKLKLKLGVLHEHL